MRASWSNPVTYAIVSGGGGAFAGEGLERRNVPAMRPGTPAWLREGVRVLRRCPRAATGASKQSGIRAPSGAGLPGRRDGGRAVQGRGADRTGRDGQGLPRPTPGPGPPRLPEDAQADAARGFVRGGAVRARGAGSEPP